MTDPAMPLYQGTKQLRARPMNKSEYCAYRGWTVPANEDPTEAGFLVEYVDGGAPNDERHKGYISWSPADVFERTYKPSETFLQRMENEFEQLDEKIGKLAAFIGGHGPFVGLSAIAQNLLIAQADAMQTYRTILSARISLAKDVPPGGKVEQLQRAA